MNNLYIKLYKIAYVGFIVQFIMLPFAFLINHSDMFYFNYIIVLWIVAMVLSGVQYGIFFKLFMSIYGNIENFRKVQQDNGAKLRKYTNIMIGGYPNFMLDMKYNKTIILVNNELNYMRRRLIILSLIPAIELITTILIIFFKVISTN